MCRAARDEAQVREVLDAFWERPGEATEALGRVSQGNQDVYRFEEMLKSDGSDGGDMSGRPPNKSLAFT